MVASVKMGVRLCYKWDEPKSVVKVEEIFIPAAKFSAQKLD